MNFRSILCFLMLSLVMCGCYSRTDYDPEFRDALSQLDKTLRVRDAVFARRIQDIDSLKERLMKTTTLPMRYELSLNLAERYCFFQSDSSTSYWMRAIKLATQLKDNQAIVHSSSLFSMFYSFTGRFYDADRILRNIQDTAHLDSKALLAYYAAKHRLARELKNIADDTLEYSRMRRTETYYCDRIIQQAPTPEMRYAYLYFRSVSNNDVAHALAYCDSIVQIPDVDLHEYAKASNHKSLLYQRIGNVKEARVWMARSAIFDMQLAIKDYNALEGVSQYLFQAGDVQRAMRYMRIVIQDTKFYHSSLRAMRNIEALPQIEQAYSQHNRRLRSLWSIMACVSVLFVVLIAISRFYVLHKNRQLNTARMNLEHSNTQLQHYTNSLQKSNQRLQKLNARLADSDKIKEAYIGSFMARFSDQINRMADTMRRVGRLAREDRLDEIKAEYGVATQRYNELKEFYRLFDSVFLNLYPTFVDDFNALLKTEGRIHIKDADTLTTELRIFALIRLGFKESAQIADLLHCSINTVYNYRSRLGRMQLSESSALENSVMQIGINDEI